MAEAQVFEHRLEDVEREANVTEGRRDTFFATRRDEILQSELNSEELGMFEWREVAPPASIGTHCALERREDGRGHLGVSSERPRDPVEGDRVVHEPVDLRVVVGA